MHYFLYVRLHGFYSRTLQGVQPELQGQPVVVVRSKRVLDSSDEAANVSSGMTLSEARAILRDGRFIQWEEERYRDAQRVWLDLMAEYTDVIEPRSQHEAFLDLSLHPDPVDIAQQIRHDLGERLGWSAGIGLASTKWLAELSAERSNEERGQASLIQEQIDLSHPLNDPEGYMAGQPIDSMLPVPRECRERLKFLGYHSAGSVARLPLSLLREQFNGQALLIYQACRGGVFQPVEPRYPERALLERVVFDGPLQDLLLLDRSLGDLARKIAAKLEQGDLQGTALSAVVQVEEGLPMSVEREFTKPMHTEREVLTGLRLLLEPVLASAESGVLAIRIQMPRLQHVRKIQTTLDARLPKKERAASSASAFQHIRKVFGDHAIEVASQIAEPRRKLLMRTWKEATGWH